MNARRTKICARRRLGWTGPNDRESSRVGRHIAAARVCRNHPEVFALVASGALHASALSLLRKHVTPENAAELFELCAHRSARKVEELLAARFPRPDVRDLVRRLPAQAGPALDVGRASEKCASEAPPCEPSVPLQQAIVASPSREPSTASGATRAARAAEAPKPGRLEPLSANRFGVHFTADAEFRELLERVRGLAGHRLPSGDASLHRNQPILKLKVGSGVRPSFSSVWRTFSSLGSMNSCWNSGGTPPATTVLK